MPANHPPAELLPCIKQLGAAAGRIEHALNEASPSVDQLGTAFTGLVSHSRRLSGLTAALDVAELDVLQGHCSEIEREASQAIIGFQFYDRLTQRLEHVRGSLLAIAELLANTDAGNSAEEWENLVIQIVETLCLDDDRPHVAGLLDHDLSRDGRPQAGANDGDIELF